jgi:hypothetical protein
MQRVHIVAEDPMEPHIADPQLFVDPFQLPGVIGPQRQKRMAAAHTVLPVLFAGIALTILRNSKFHLVFPILLSQ